MKLDSRGAQTKSMQLRKKRRDLQSELSLESQRYAEMKEFQTREKFQGFLAKKEAKVNTAELRTLKDSIAQKKVFLGLLDEEIVKRLKAESDSRVKEAEASIIRLQKLKDSLYKKGLVLRKRIQELMVKSKEFAAEITENKTKLHSERFLQPKFFVNLDKLQEFLENNFLIATDEALLTDAVVQATSENEKILAERLNKEIIVSFELVLSKDSYSLMEFDGTKLKPIMRNWR